MGRNRRIRHLTAAAGAGMAWAALAFGIVVADDDAEGTTVTVYRVATSSTAVADAYSFEAYGYPRSPTDRSAIVVDVRYLELDAGMTSIQLGNVPRQLKAATVRFRSITDPTGTQVVRQQLANPLESVDSVLRNYLDHDIVVVTERGDIAGTLRSFDDLQLVVETDDPDQPLHIITRGEHVWDIKLMKRAEPLVTEASLLWTVNAAQAGEHLVEVTYRTEGIDWDTDYTAIYDEIRETIDFSAWVTIDNTSGVDLSDADIVLVSDMAPAASNPLGVGAVAGNADAWTFSIDEHVALPSGKTAHLELFEPIIGAAAERVTVFEPWEDTSTGTVKGLDKDCSTYRYDTFGYRHEIDTVVSVARGAADNAESLPHGPVRVYRSTEAGAIELLGQDALQIDPDTGAMGIRVGSNGDITGQRRQLDCSVDEYRRRMRERIEIQLNNDGDEAIDVIVREYMQRGPTWRVDVESVAGRMVGKTRHEYRVTVAPGETNTISYTVIYTW